MPARYMHEAARGFGAAWAAAFWRVLVIVFGAPIWLLLSPYFLWRRMGPVLTLEQWITWGEDVIARVAGLEEYPRYPTMAGLSQRKARPDGAVVE